MIGPRDNPTDLLPASPPVYSLLRTPGVLVTPRSERWLAGVSIEPEACNIALDLDEDLADFPYWWECEDSDGVSAPTALAASPRNGVKTIIAGEAPLDFDAITLWAGVRCSTLDIHGPRAAEYQARALRKLNAVTPAAVEHEFWTGAIANLAGFPNPALMDAGTVTELNGGSPLGFVNALAELEQAIAEDGNLVGRGLIHAQPRVATVWASHLLVEPTPDGTALVTKNGTYVVPGYGYPGTPTLGTAPDQTASYAYATGGVRVFLSNPRTAAFDSSAVGRTLNDTFIRAERDMIAVWNPCLHIGLNVSLCDPFCGSES